MTKNNYFIASLLACCVSLSSFAQYTWKPVQIQGGGFVSGLVFSETQQNLGYCRTDVGGAFRWDGTTKTWTSISDFLKHSEEDYMGCLGIAIDRTNANKVAMMTGLYTASWAGNGRFYISNDKGNAWTKTDVPFKVGGNETGRGAGERLQFDPNLGSKLYYGTNNDGLYVSTNNGAAWSKVGFFPVSTGNISFVYLDRNSSSAGNATSKIYVGVLATGSNNLFVSTDAGNSWSAVPNQPTNLMPFRAAMASNGSFYITYNNTSGPNSTPSSGEVWKLTTTTNQWTNITPVTGQFGFGGISVSSTNPDLVFVSTLTRWFPADGLYRTTNGGTSWTDQNANNANVSNASAPYANMKNPHWIVDLKIDPFDQNHVKYVTGYGIITSYNATASTVNWIFENKGIEETVVNGIVSPSSGNANLLSVIGDLDGFIHANLDESPNSGAFPNHFRATTGIDIAENNAQIIARVNEDGNPSGRFTLNGGSTWQDFNTGKGSNVFDKIAISANGSKWVWSTPNSAGTVPRYTANNGVSWNDASGVPAGVRVISDRANDAKFYAFDAIAGKVYASTNSGQNFSETASGLPTVFDWEKRNAEMKSTPSKDGHVWICLPDGLRRSTTSGTAFSKVNGVSKAIRIGFGKAASGANYPAIFLLGVVNGVEGYYRSDDEAITWVRINDDKTFFGGITEIAGDPRVFGRVYVATRARGIQYGQPAITTSFTESETETEFIQVYPNPSSGKVRIVSKSELIINQLELYDLAGNLLMRFKLADELDLSAFESGIYVLKIFANNKNQVVRIIKN